MSLIITDREKSLGIPVLHKCLDAKNSYKTYTVVFARCLFFAEKIKQNFNFEQR
jgi:hypothetical protein